MAHEMTTDVLSGLDVNSPADMATLVILLESHMNKSLENLEGLQSTIRILQEHLQNTYDECNSTAEMLKDILRYMGGMSEQYEEAEEPDW